MTQDTITTNSIVFDGKVLVAAPDTGPCFGCHFRKDGKCQMPEELKAYSCLSTLRSDYRNIIWKESK